MSTALCTWITDSETSDNVIGNKGILSTLHSISSSLFVILADGSISYTEGEGSINAPHYYHLSFMFQNFYSICYQLAELRNL